jgi:hypothetical protein
MNRRFQQVSSYDACWFDQTRLHSDQTLGPPPLEALPMPARVSGTKR